MVIVCEVATAGGRRLMLFGVRICGSGGVLELGSWGVGVLIRSILWRGNLELACEGCSSSGMVGSRGGSGVSRGWIVCSLRVFRGGGAKDSCCYVLWRHRLSGLLDDSAVLPGDAWD